MTFQFACRKLQRSKNLEPASPDSLIQYPVSSIQYRESSIVNPVSSIQYRVSRIENPTLAHFRHFRHFSSLFTLSPLYICRESSTNQLLFMQNKPNVKDAQINVNSYMKSKYEIMDTWLSGKNKANSNPNKPNFKCKCSLAQITRCATLERQLCNGAPESLLANKMELSDKLT